MKIHWFLHLEQLNSIAFHASNSMFIERWILSIGRLGSSQVLNGGGDEGQPWWDGEHGFNTVFNSLDPGKSEWHFRYLILQIISVIDGWGISCELALRWMSLDLTDDKSTLVQVMAWYRQATCHYLGQCWPRSLSLYGVTRPQWVKRG